MYEWWGGQRQLSTSSSTATAMACSANHSKGSGGTSAVDAQLIFGLPAVSYWLQRNIHLSPPPRRGANIVTEEIVRNSMSDQKLNQCWSNKKRLCLCFVGSLCLCWGHRWSCHYSLWLVLPTTARAQVQPLLWVPESLWASRPGYKEK